MVALVSKETDLRRVGTRWTGLCPFHEERTPSFSVNAEEKLFHCFGCQKGGDAIGFVMETEGAGLPRGGGGAGRALRRGAQARARGSPGGGAAQAPRAAAGAARAHDRLLRRRSCGRRPRPGGRATTWPAAGWGRRCCARSGSATRPRRGTGCSPARARAATRRRSCSPRGLASRARNGNLLDRFRERIMFPLADNRGRVLGFGARAMRDEQGAKYINTAENEIYKKGRQLFGIDRARAAIAKAGHAVVVEGYTDVLALHAAGVRGGRGHHGHRRHAGPGRRAGARRGRRRARCPWRSTPTAPARRRCCARPGSRGSAQVQLRVVRLPEGTRSGRPGAGRGRPEAVRDRLTQSVSVLEFEVGRVLDDADLDSPEGADRALVAVRELIATAPAAAARSATASSAWRPIAWTCRWTT